MARRLGQDDWVTLVRLGAGDYAAAIDTRGGGLHSFSNHGAPLVVPATTTERPGAWAGMILAPWPNRLAGGRYEFAGESLQVPVNELHRDNALHGLVWSLDWEVVDATPSTAQLSVTHHPSPGYPWRLELEAFYLLDAGGLTLRVRAINRSDRAAPFGCGFHPYVLAPGGNLDESELSFGAVEQLDVTPDRLLPRGMSTVAGGPFDFAEPRRVGSTSFDTAFTALARDRTGRASLALRNPDGHASMRCWWDESFRWVQLYTPAPERPGMPRASIAVEPMTCSADAFNSGVDLIRFEPGEAWSGTLGMSAVGAAR